jgi:hypothetical protein
MFVVLLLMIVVL